MTIDALTNQGAQPADQRLLHWLTLLHTPGLGPVGAGRLLDTLGGIDAVMAAGLGPLRALGLRADAAEALAGKRARPAAEQELRRIRHCGLHCLCRDDPAYPALLKEISDPPLVLYGRGDLAALQEPGLAVVGARAATVYGKKIAESLSRELATGGLTIISGGALGIDSAAHQGALAAAGGRTIAVLGCGVDVCYPPQNQKLFAHIAQRGLLLSEYPLGTQPEPFRFPARNRIISGLALGCLVVEAAGRSGSLITAELALEQGREVFAIPGRVDSSKSAGCHRLIQQGAKLVQQVGDIISELPPLARPAGHLSAGTEQGPHPDSAQPAKAEPTASASPETRQLLAALDTYPRDLEEIIAACRLPPHRVSSLLLELELRGRVESAPGPQYRLT